MVESAALLCPEKKEAFENIPLSRRTVTRRVQDIAENLEFQLQSEVVSFDFFSLALDESCDVRDTAQLLIFLRGITRDFKLTEELAAMWPMKGTPTGSDLFAEQALCKSVLKLSHVVDVVTTTVNFIRARALNHRQFVSLLEEQESEHGDVRYHTAVRWLSLGKVLKRFWVLKSEIKEFCEMKGKTIPELSDKDWVADLTFAVDVTAMMNELNTQLQGKGLFAHEMHSHVKAFMTKLQFISRQLGSNNLEHMKTLKEFKPSADHRHSVDSAPTDVQLELIDLQSDSLLKEHFKSASLLEFYSALKEENFPNMRRHAQKMLVLFGSTYICEQTFSVMKFTKSRYRSSLTDEHLSAVLRISTSDIQPDFDGLVKAQQRLDFSH
ncbi:General transcription factor II-I repeat domain-containing protein 2B [Merluccius polli]|uniref:General transcription factor II-I repeat domain-containing protein 2B n=1 Tax=Merluccius polli TaxID=89951 RepID=A0AA47MD72_MERPO|nr:General transcription factor II-I repeat domain-containing protein 2B [Merluccius polli]